VPAAPYVARGVAAFLVRGPPAPASPPEGVGQAAHARLARQRLLRRQPPCGDVWTRKIRADARYNDMKGRLPGVQPQHSVTRAMERFRISVARDAPRFQGPCCGSHARQAPVPASVRSAAPHHRATLTAVVAAAVLLPLPTSEIAQVRWENLPEIENLQLGGLHTSFGLRGPDEFFVAGSSGLTHSFARVH
jgi:hypothetical protein